jgi:hypothetical protein
MVKEAVGKKDRTLVDNLILVFVLIAKSIPSSPGTGTVPLKMY